MLVTYLLDHYRQIYSLLNFRFIQKTKINKMCPYNNNYITKDNLSTQTPKGQELPDILKKSGKKWWSCFSWSLMKRVLNFMRNPKLVHILVNMLTPFLSFSSAPDGHAAALQLQSGKQFRLLSFTLKTLHKLPVSWSRHLNLQPRIVFTEV